VYFKVIFNFSNQEARRGESMQQDSKVPSIAKRSSLAGAQVNTHTHKPYPIKSHSEAVFIICVTLVTDNKRGQYSTGEK
jgi:hypothetical protein